MDELEIKLKAIAEGFPILDSSEILSPSGLEEKKSQIEALQCPDEMKDRLMRQISTIIDVKMLVVKYK